jgi:hypothetical protein
MYKQELFAKAKESIFGQPPECRLAQIGYNIAVSYYSILIAEAEPVLQKLEKPRTHFQIYLKNALEFSSYGAFRQFPPESLAVLNRCSENFRTRYEPLLEGLRHHQG